MNTPKPGGAERLFRAAFLTSLLAGAIPCALAVDGAAFEAPIFRGNPGTESALWTAFTDAEGLPGNAPNSVASGGVVLADAIVTQDVPGIAFVTGGGNIYSFSAATKFTLADTTAYTTGIGLVVFQAETLGTEISYPLVRLTCDLGSGPTSLATARTELFRGSLGGFGGSDVVSKWEWDLTGLGVNSYTIQFEAAGSSLSLDALALDTATPGAVVVPEPAQSGLVCGLVVFRRVRRA